MRDVPVIRTARLTLRGFHPRDLDAMAALNADPEVRAFLGPPLDRAQTASFLDDVAAEWVREGWGLWCAADATTDDCLGFIGLHAISFDAPFADRIEIGWRLASPVWGRGLASEGARAARDWAHRVAALEQLVAITAAINVRSRRVMDKIGLRRDFDGDFLHPLVDPASSLCAHVLYRGQRDDWLATSPSR